MAVACLKYLQTYIVSRKLINPMPSRQAKLQEDTYFRVMRILQENPDLTQRELAEKLGISVGGLNYCLKALMDKGMVKMKNFANAKNKFGYVYVLTPTGMAEKAAITHRFLQRKMAEYEALHAEIEALKREHAEGPDPFSPTSTV
jgi:EPS-associated MarR family transcriptional regulator